MNTKQSISKVFREEAIRHYSREPDSGGVLKPAPTWTWSVLIGTGLLVVLAALFVSLAEVEVLERATGVVQVQDARARPQTMAAQILVVATLAENDNSFVQAGDSVRVQLNDYPLREFGDLNGRVLRLVAGQSQRKGDPATRQAPPQSWRLEVEVIPADSGPLARIPLRDGMAVTVRLPAHQQRIISILFDPLRRWFT